MQARSSLANRGLIRWWTDTCKSASK